MKKWSELIGMIEKKIRDLWEITFHSVRNEIFPPLLKKLLAIF